MKAFVLAVGLGLFPVLACAESSKPPSSPKPPASAQDTLKIEGIAPGDEVVVMLFGRTSAGCMNATSDPAKTTFSTTGEVLLGNMLSKGRCRSQVAVFSKKHAMKWQPLNWTDRRGDVRTIKLDPLIDAALNIWVTTDEQKAAAERHAQKAQDLFIENRVGVRLVWKVLKLSEVPGAPSDAAKIVHDGLSNDQFADCDGLGPIRKQPFYVAKTLNVYYVDRQQLAGRNCAIKVVPMDQDTCFKSAQEDAVRADGNITFIGNKADPTTLAHELGHAYGLRPISCGAHASGPDFPSNIMTPDDDSTTTADRTKFTLGQVFRMNTHKDDWGGTMLIPNNIPKRVAQTCFPSQADRACPPLETPWP
jgi:hypothetical protein